MSQAYVFLSDPEINNYNTIDVILSKVIGDTDSTYQEELKRNTFKLGLKNIKNVFRYFRAKFTRKEGKKREILYKILRDYAPKEINIYCQGDFLGNGLVGEIVRNSADETEFLENIKNAYEKIFEKISKYNVKFHFILGNHDIKSEIFKDWWKEWRDKHQKYQNVVWLGYTNYLNRSDNKDKEFFRKYGNIGVIEGSPEVPRSWGPYGKYTNTYQGVSDDDIKKMFEKVKDKDIIFMHKGYSKKEGDEKVISGNLPNNDLATGETPTRELEQLLRDIADDDKDQIIICGHWHNGSIFKKGTAYILNPGNNKAIILINGKLHTKEL